MSRRYIIVRFAEILSHEGDEYAFKDEFLCLVE